MGRRPRKIDYFHFIATIAMFCLPILVHERLNQIYVDGTVNALDIKTFVDDFSSQNTAQITLVSDISGFRMRTDCINVHLQAGVIMAVDAGFLAVQGVGTGTVAESILKGSIIFCVGCMFAGMFAQHFGEKLKSLRFAVCFYSVFCSLILTSSTDQAYYLDQGMTVVLGVFSAPRFFCIMRQVIWLHLFSPIDAHIRPTEVLYGPALDSSQVPL
jgi:hypothetical protein